jgi:hypothetical protein
MIYISKDGVQGYVGSLGLIPWSKKEENIMEGDEEVGSKEILNKIRRTIAKGMHAWMMTQCMAMVW